MSTSNQVKVTEISAQASEKTVKDFFLFCGKISNFELIKEESSDKQIAFVTFERSTAAKTALMLTNAVIGDCQIVVRPADDASYIDDLDDVVGDIQANKPKAAIVAEILAAGYSVQDTIIEKAIECDSKYGLSNLFKQYLAQLQANLKNLDEQYKVTKTVTGQATNINEKYAVLDNAKKVIDQAQEKFSTFLETSTGKRIIEYLCYQRKNVAGVQSLARKIADDKKHERTLTLLPSHSHPEDVQAETEPIAE